jgi:hypothetical protein
MKSIKTFFVCLFFFTHTTNSHADVDNPFRIDNIYVSASTGDLVDSKSIALEKGVKEALIKLILDLVATNSHDDITKIATCLKHQEFSRNIVQDYAIKSERMTSRAYSASVDFIFSPNSVRDIMNTCGIQYASVSSRETLLLPLVYERNSYRLIDEESDGILNDVFNNISDDIGLIHIKKFSNNSIFDATELDPSSFINGTYKDITEILKRYQCQSAIVLAFKDYNKKSISVEARITRKNEEYHDSFRYNIKSGESQKMFLSRVVDSLLKNADLIWKRGVEKGTDVIFNSGVTLHTSSPSDWKEVKNILNKISIIKQYKFKTVDNNEIDLELKYTDSPETLSKRLMENGVIIFRSGDQTIMKLKNQKQQ